MNLSRDLYSLFMSMTKTFGEFFPDATSLMTWNEWLVFPEPVAQVGPKALDDEEVLRGYRALVTSLLLELHRWFLDDYQ